MLLFNIRVADIDIPTCHSVTVPIKMGARRSFLRNAVIGDTAISSL